MPTNASGTIIFTLLAGLFEMAALSMSIGLTRSGRKAATGAWRERWIPTAKIALIAVCAWVALKLSVSAFSRGEFWFACLGTALGILVFGFTRMSLRSFDPYNPNRDLSD